MSQSRQKYLCDAVAAVKAERLFITVFQVNDGMEFESGRGEVKYGSPRRVWTPVLIKHEIARAFGAQAVLLTNLDDTTVGAMQANDTKSKLLPPLPAGRLLKKSSSQSR